MSSFSEYTNAYKKKKKKDAEEWAEKGVYFEGDEIAPVKKTENTKKTEKTEEKRSWFNKGAFDDGYQFGDIFKTIVASSDDLGENVTAGILGIGEKVVDAGAYVAGAVGGLFGADKFAESTKEFIAKDLYDEEEIAKKTNLAGTGISTLINKVILGVDSDKDSVFGEKTDSLAQSGGQLVGTIGLQAVGVPWFVTTGTTSFGSEVEGAFNEDASYGEAGLSATISAGAEILSEKLFGGSGLGEKGLINLEPLTKGVTNKVFKALLDFGVDMTAEGSEEVFSSVMSRLGSSLYNEKNVDELLLSEEAFDEYLESFIGGMALGGVANTGKAASSIKTGRDYRTGLTTNEQAVVDKVYNDRIAEAEKNGEKLTAKEKTQIYNDVVEAMEKGAIDTDTIESVLGGEDYKKYQSEIKRQQDLENELKELRNMKSGEMTDIQIERMSELKAMKPNTEILNTLKFSVDENIRNGIKDTRLLESYNEKARRGQAFESDLTQYDTKMQETVKKAVESGILNNTRRTHEFVDMIAKISAEKGVLFDFTNNEKLKASGFAVDGKTVNGYVTKDGVTLNVQSAKALNSVVGHEVTHVLEGTELYEALRQTITEYAKNKKDYESRRKAHEELYKNVEGADIDAELTADLVGDYLFTDSDFIKHLSTSNRNVFQKIYDEIKYLYKVATAGSKEARELERVKKAFEKAYRESGKTNTEVKAEDIAEADTKYSISVTDKDTIDFLENQEHIVTYKSMQLIDGKLYPPMAAKVKGPDGKYKLNNPSTLGVWQQATEDPTNIKKIKNGVGYYTLNKGDGTSIDAAYNPYEHSSNLVLNDQFESAHRRNNLVTVECVIPVSEMSSGYKAEYAKDTTGVMDWKSGVVAGQIKDNKRLVYLSRYLKPVRILSEAETAAKYKDILEGTGVSVPFNVVSPSLLAELEKAGVDIDYNGSPMYQSIQKRRAEKQAKKKEVKYSLTPEQQEYFKDSKVRDENGDLKVMYHGTSKGGHTVFDTYGSNYGLFGQGSYFTDNKSVAESYTKKGKGNTPQIYETYLNITNPMDMDAEADPKAWAKAFPDATFPESGTNEDFYRAMEEYFMDEQYPKWEAAAEAVDSIMGMGYDGITHIGGGRFNKADETRHRVYIAFNPEQIKNIDNAKPTDNPDIRYSLSDSEGTKLTEEQSEYFKDSKAVDRNGNLLKVYHTTNNDFTVFDKSRKGEATGDTNTYLGFFFADDAEYMQNFPEFKNGKTESYYLNITNPIDMTDISKEAFLDIVEVLGGDVTEASEIYDQELSDEKDRAQLRGDNNTNLQLGNLLIEMTGDFDYREFIEELKPHYNELMSKGYDGVVNYLDELWGAKEYIVLDSNQAKLTSNLKPTTNPDIRYSLSKEGETPKANGRYNVYGKDVALETAPVREDISKTETTTESNIPTVDEAEMFPNEPNLYDLYREQKALEDKMREAVETNDADTVNSLMPSYEALLERIKQMETDQKESFANLDDADAPPEMEAPYTESEGVTPDNPFENRDIKEVGNKKVKAYMYENPEVKPFFQAEAEAMLGELQNTIKGERIYISTPDGRPGEYGSDSYGYWTGVKRHTTADIAYLVDTLGYSYAEIEKGLKAIIEDNGKENNACSKRIEFLLNDRLMNGYQDAQFGFEIKPNQDYINLLNEKQITEYNDEARKALFESLETESAPTKEYEAIKPNPEKLKGEEAQWAKNKMARADKVSEEHQTAEILDKEPEAEKKKSRWLSKFRTNIVDKHSVFEDLALKTKNRELMGKANHMLSSESRAQWLIGHGTEGVKSLNDIRAEVEKTGLTKEFYEYLYHKHNIDRMNLEGRYKDVKNKPVFGYNVTSEKSQEVVNQYEFAEPMFKEYAQDVYDYMNHLRRQLVDNGVISQETADLWSEMYPHYVPIRRLGDSGLNINVPLDTGRTGVNAPIKKATGGSRDILPLFDTMAMRTEQTYRAIARNSFGVELKNTLGTGFVENKVNFEEVVDSIEKQEELLQKGENGQKPTFTVFENGKKVTFEITEDMYDALKPTNEFFAKSNKTLNKINNVRRGLITEYNPVFLVTNAVKDAQDLLMNSQHAAKTYKNFPKAIKELATKGKWYTEYMENGGEQNTYFDGKTNTFKAEDKGFKKVIGMPLRAISAANNFIERAPRLAEYIASRESGASVEVAMLDAARVTTNFAAGGQVTQWADRNGATFLNASVQGFNQQIRNVREAKANGLKGWLGLATKTAIAGIPALILNNLLWDDDEEYEELSDYVKDNYYVVAKYGDGQFVRIPKGRTVAVIQDAFEQVSNMLTGDDEADFNSFFELFLNNLAPNNPLDNSIISPITQVLENKTWYGEDLVPTRLQDLPASEQYDESTDALSKWLGETFDMSPYKINYLLDQYSGALGDVFLPMMTPEAESGDNSLLGNIIAPFKDKFTTDSVMNNQNVSAFYETVDELTTNAKSSKATDEDILKSKYINSISSELGELYAKKREIQNSNLSDTLKYTEVREIQKQIDAITKESLNTYNNVRITDGYAEIGDRHFRLNDDGEWQKITDEQLEKQNDVTSGLGISPSEYWKKKAEYDYAYKYPEKYEFLNKNGITYDDYKNGSEEFKEAYSWAFDNPEKFTMSKAIASDVVTYRRYASELNDIKADKDEDGKSISGSRKEKVIEYCNNLDADYGEKIILFKSQYNADDTYNYDIIEYLNGREDISYEEMVTILKELGFKVDSNGNVTWD